MAESNMPEHEDSKPEKATKPTRSTASNSFTRNTDGVASNLWANFRVALPAIAARFAIAFVAGLYVREMQDKNDPRTVDVGGIGQDNQSGEVSPRYLELVSNGNNGTGVDERIKTPVMNHTNFDPTSFARNVNDLKPKLQQVVNQSGLHANEKTHMVPVEDHSGNKMIVPLTEIKLSPSKFEDFQ